MSWQDDIKNIKFEIITGDKLKWYPALVPNYVKNVEYNGTQYDFIERSGSLFARRLPKGRSYPLEFAFKGPDNVKVANAFEKSARDTRPWTINHPFYGQLTVQPLSLSANSSGFDSTIIQVQVIETIVANQPKEIPDYKDIIEAQIEATQNATLVALKPIESGIPVKNTQLAMRVTDNIATRVEAVSSIESEYKNYQKVYRSALNEINNASGISHGFMVQLMDLITMPCTIAADIGSRIQVLNNTLLYLIENLTGIASVGYFESLFYNLVGSGIITASCKALITQNSGDFQTKQEIHHFINILKDQYNSYLENLYYLESEEFTPDHDLMFALHTLVCETVYMLYQIMFSAKQERIYYPPRDTNLILLAHRLYGKASEENILTLKNSNALGISELLNIKKDRPIRYYV